MRHPWVIVGRPLKPFPLALAVADATIGATYLANTGVLGSNTWADAAAVLALLAVLLLVAGFLRPSTRWAADGLAVSAGVWAYLATLYALTLGVWTPSVWLAVGWTIAAGGACRLELNDGGKGSGE